jgi:hypothetical protein
VPDVNPGGNGEITAYEFNKLGDKQSLSLLHECHCNVNNVLKAVGLSWDEGGVNPGAHGRLGKDEFAIISKKMVDIK